MCLAVCRWIGRLGLPDRVGLGLILALVAWAKFAAALSGRALSPLSPYVVVPVALVLGVTLGKVLSRHVGHRFAVQGLLAAAVVLLVAVLATDGPAKWPLGYANANAALAVQVIGLCGLAISSAHKARRPLVWSAGLCAVGAVIANRSAAGLALALPLLAVFAVVTFRPPRWRRWIAGVIAASLTLSGAATATVVWLAGRGDWPAWATSLLDPARESLWRDAWSLWSDHSFVGAGPGAFREFASLGDDSDTASAHSSVLQLGAETGWVGAGLFALIFLTGLWRVARGAPVRGVVGSAAWTALFVHSLVDHLIEFPAIIVTAGIVVGWAGERDTLEELDVPEGEDPGGGHGR